MNWVIGVDYGTDSVRSVILDAADGRQIATATFAYPRWQKGMYCDAAQNRFRQHPLDYTEGLQATVKSCLEQAGPNAVTCIKAISIATTGSTPVAVNDRGIPLGLLPDFEANPNALFILWKDHSAIAEAAEINRHATGTDYLKYSGGVYSSEWLWAKLLHILRTDDEVAKACYTWVEHCDWMPFLLTGGNDANQIKRSRCAAGHKALWSAEWNGFPPGSFFSGIDPVLNGFAEKLPEQTYTADQSAGTLCAEWAEKLGLSTSVLIGIGALDAHMGAVGAGIVPYYLSKVMGTSTCDMLVAPAADIGNKTVRGICGQVDGSIIPGMIGMEAGQSAFGDVFAWFKGILEFPLSAITDPQLKQQVSEQILTNLSDQAAALPLTLSSVYALDWLNGRRTPDANPLLTGALTGLNLATGAPEIFRALAEATC